MIIAGIVLYNPDIYRLRENIGAIETQVDSLIIVNNGSENWNECKSLCDEYKVTKVIQNVENQGIAKALKQIMNAAKKMGATWVLTLDQDSVCDEHLISRYKQYIYDTNIGILTCNIIDRNIPIIPKINKHDIEEVDFCITSASLINVSAYEKTSGFDEIMFIDKVDFDLCLSMRECGYKIVKVNVDGLLHEVGKSRLVSVLGNKFVLYNHRPSRRYYMSRNAIYIARKHESISLVKEFFKELRRILMVLIYEDKKWEKFINSIKGIRDGIFMPISVDCSERKYK